MKVLLFGLAGFIIGLSGGTIVGVLSTPGAVEEAAAEAEAADGTDAAEAAEGESGAELPVQPIWKAGLGALLGIFREPEPDAVQPDSIAAEEPERPAGTDAGGAPDAVPAEDPALAQEGGAAPGSEGEGDVVPAAHVSPEGARRLAMMFRAMKPAEAARVLERLDADEIEAILAQMSERQAGTILSHFDPARAAEVTRTVFATGGQP